MLNIPDECVLFTDFLRQIGERDRIETIRNRLNKQGIRPVGRISDKGTTFTYYLKSDLARMVNKKRAKADVTVFDNEKIKLFVTGRLK